MSKDEGPIDLDVFHAYAVPLAHALQAADRSRPLGECIVEAATKVYRSYWKKGNEVGFGVDDPERAAKRFGSVVIEEGRAVLLPSDGKKAR